MYILLIIWFLFLIVYLGFNAYGLSRAYRMRIKGDAAGFAMFIYLVTIGVIVLVSLILILSLDWGNNFKLPLG